MGSLWPVVLDGLVLVLLAVTIFFAARLSLYLKAFRDSREDLEVMIKNLARQIDSAQASVSGMRETARDSGRDLQEKIGEARALMDELHFMTESGDNMARRLERVAERNRDVMSAVPLRDKDEPPGKKTNVDYSFSKKKTGKDGDSPNRTDEPAFRIKDPEFEGLKSDEGVYADEQGLMPDEAVREDSFHSRAERELFEALKGGSAQDSQRRKSKSGGVS